MAPRIEPVPEADLPDFETLFEPLKERNGQVLNSYATLAHAPEILRGTAQMAGSIMRAGAIPLELKGLVGFVSSNAAGCRFCQAHMAKTASLEGASIEKLRAAFEYDSNPIFSEAERAALRLAAAASVLPNAATDAHFEELRRHFDEKEIVEIVAVVALFGFMNRWNDTVQTELEPFYSHFVEECFPELEWR
jgi:uncharacterized peroxidase-related enzyme